MMNPRLGALALGLALGLAPLADATAQSNPFHWLEGATASITTGNSSSNVALLKMPTGATQLRVYSSCATTVFVRKGVDGTVAATIADLPIAPGSVEVLTLLNSPSAPIAYMAMISPSGSCTVYFTTGEGY